MTLNIDGEKMNKLLDQLTELLTSQVLEVPEEETDMHLKMQTALLLLLVQHSCEQFTESELEEIGHIADAFYGGFIAARLNPEGELKS